MTAKFIATSGNVECTLNVMLTTAKGVENLGASDGRTQFDVPTHSFMKNRPFTPFGIPLSGILLITLALTGGCTTVSPKPSARITSTPVKTEDTNRREDLRQLEAFLDGQVDKALENELRQRIDHWDDLDLQQRYPEWKKFALDRPGLTDAMKSEKLFFLHRSLAHMTGNLPLETRHIQQLDDFLDIHPAIRDPLEVDPALLTNLDFLLKYPALAAFFDKHPDLFTVFAQNAPTRVAQ
jgi:hypothetical protein